MSHSNPGEVPDLQDKLDHETLDFFTVFLAFMARCENLTKSFGALIGNESYTKKNPYEWMLLVRFYQEQSKSKTQYLYSVNKIFTQPGDRSKSDKIKDFVDRYDAYEEKYRDIILKEEREKAEANAKARAELNAKATTEPTVSVAPMVVREKVRPYDVAKIFCQRELGFMIEDPIKKRTATKQAIEFISSLLGDDAFYTSFANASYACVVLPPPKDLSEDIKVAAKLTDKEDATASPLAAPFQALTRTPMMLEKLLELMKKDQTDKNALNALAQKIQPLLHKSHMMALSVKKPIDYNFSFTFNFVRLLNGIQLLEDNKKSDKDAETMLILLKLSASLPQIYDSMYFEKKSLVKSELATIAKVSACLKSLQGKNEMFPELQETLEEINKLFSKFNQKNEVVDFLRESKTAIPSNVEIDQEDMDYVLNRYLYMFAPPKPSIPAAEAEVIQKYINEYRPKLTEHSVMVLQNPATKKSVLGSAATAAVGKLQTFRRRGSSMASETPKTQDSPPRVASPESLKAGFTLDEVFPPPELSGMKVPPPPIPTKAAPELPRRSYDKKRVSDSISLEKAATPKADTRELPPMPPRPKVKTTTTAAPKEAPVVIKPVAKTAAPVVTKPVIETKPAAPILNTANKKRESFTSGNKGVIGGRDGPTDELAEKLKRRLNIIDEKSKPAEQKPSEKPKPPRGGSPTGSI